MQRSKKEPLRMARMIQSVDQALDLMRDREILIQFKSLKPQKDIVPWILQTHLRADSFWETLSMLSQNTVWTLLGATMKPHNLHQSRPAAALAEMLNLAPKGKGKSKTNGKGYNKGGS